MKEFWDKYKVAIIGILVILIVIGIIYYYGKSEGKKYVPNDIVIPPDTQAPGTPGIYNPGPITDALFQDMDEVFGVHESAPYAAANKLSNSQLAAVYNDWNKRYSKDFDNQTIIQAIENEFSIIPFFSSWYDTASLLVERFKSLYGAQGRTLKN